MRGGWVSRSCPGQGGAVEPPRRKRSRLERIWARVQTCDRGLWAAVLPSQPVGRATLPAASLSDLQPRRASGRGLGCECELQEARGAREGLSSGPTAAQGLGQVLGPTRAKDCPRGRAQRKHLGRRRRAFERRCPGNRTALGTAS